jgi:predicted proteasome-type protease
VLRQLICGLVVLAVVPGVALAEDKKAKDKTVTGKFVSYKDGTLTIKVQLVKGEEPKDQTYKVADDFKVVTLSGEEKKEAVAKDAFKGLKDGTSVTVTLGEGDKITGVQIGTAKKIEKPAVKEKVVTGTFVSFKDGTLTVKVRAAKGEEPKDQTYKIADDFKVITLSGEDKKEAVAKDSFRDAKEGSPVTIKIGDGDKVTGVQIGSAKKKDK